MNQVDLWRRRTALAALAALAAVVILSLTPAPAIAAAGGEASLIVPDLGQVAFGPISGRALDALGMTGSLAWAEGRWWTLLTAIYLHGGILHIIFNVLWIRQLGPEIEQLYGPARLVVIFTVSGIAGFVVSNWIGVPFTIGASGSIFGLLGAIVAFGRKRGGVFGRMVLRQYGQWALVLFALGFFMQGVNNWAHGGGFLGGFLTGLALSLAEHRDETGFDKLLALVAIVLTLAGFGLALWTAFGV